MSPDKNTEIADEPDFTENGGEKYNHKRTLFHRSPASIYFLNPKSDSFYIQHRKSLQLINALATKAGPEKSQEAIDLFTYIADMAEEIIESKDRKDE